MCNMCEKINCMSCMNEANVGKKHMTLKLDDANFCGFFVVSMK